MTHDELRQLEGARRRALWALASLRPGDPTASELLATLDELDDLDLNATSSTQKPLELIEVRNSVSVERHHSGMDIILEHTIPQPWRERFHQASVGSTRLVDGPTPQAGINSWRVGKQRCDTWSSIGPQDINLKKNERVRAWDKKMTRCTAISRCR